jgi:riboflavin biosynthesis pyrimidine reductase
VRQLFPAAVAEPDVGELYAYPPSVTGPAGRPWVRGNMVASVDGAAALDGRSGGLSGDADKAVFRILRSQADVVVAGSGTVTDEHYRPAQLSAMVPGLRAGRTATPPIAVVTGSLNLDLSASLFTAAPPEARTIVITSESCPPDRLKQAQRHADVIVAGAEHVDPARAVEALAERGLPRVLCEGGPHLLAQFAAAGRLDELCLTISPLLAGGDAGRILAGPSLAGGLSLGLGHVLEDQGFLLCRYTVSSA